MSDKDPYDFLPEQPNPNMDPNVAERLKRSGPRKPPETAEEFKQFVESRPAGTSKPLSFGPDGVVKPPSQAFSPPQAKPPVAPVAPKTQVKLPNAPDWEQQDDPEEKPKSSRSINYAEITERVERQSSLSYMRAPADDTKGSNPLASYFRTPELYVRLPSQGKYNKPEDFQFEVDGTIGIFPMTAKDDMILRTPDALLNGSALRQLVESCAPGVRNVSKLPAPDFDVILMAIRSVSYGPQMDFETPCPKCKKINTWGIDIPSVLDTVVPMGGPAETTLRSGVKIFLAPYTFDAQVKAALVGFEETQLVRAVNQQNVSEAEKLLQFGESMGRISELNRQLYAESILYVETPDGQKVTDKQFIFEFINKIAKPDFDIIDKRIQSLNKEGFQRTAKITCDNPECKHEHEVDITYDPTRFFGSGS